MNKELTSDTAAVAARHARYGRLPERIRHEDMSEGAQDTQGKATSYDPEGSWKFYSCLALDLGL